MRRRAYRGSAEDGMTRTSIRSCPRLSVRDHPGSLVRNPPRRTAWSAEIHPPRQMTPGSEVVGHPADVAAGHPQDVQHVRQFLGEVAGARPPDRIDESLAGNGLA